MIFLWVIIYPFITFGFFVIYPTFPYTTIHSISVFILTDLYSESSVKAIRIL